MTPTPTITQKSIISFHRVLTGDRSGFTFEKKQNQKYKKSIDHYLLRIWAFYEFSMTEQLTLERYSFHHLVFFILEIGILCKLSCYKNKLISFFTLALFSLANYSPEWWIPIDNIYKPSIKCRSKSTKTCCLHGSLVFLSNHSLTSEDFDWTRKIRYGTVLQDI